MFYLYLVCSLLGNKCVFKSYFKNLLLFLAPQAQRYFQLIYIYFNYMTLFLVLHKIQSHNAWKYSKKIFKDHI